jgi:serine/threonine protein phosphatase PrpC
MSCFGLTDRGIARQENQDSFLIENCEKASCSIIALCDGMGGANAGGLASQLSAKAFVNYVYHHLSTYPTRLTDYPRVLREPVMRQTVSHMHILSLETSSPGWALRS